MEFVNNPESLNKPDALSYIRNLLSFLGKKQNIEDNEIFTDAIVRLSCIYFHYRAFRDNVCEELISNKFDKIADDIFRYLVKENKSESSSMDLLLNVLINFSDFSSDFASSILRSVFTSLVDFCIEKSEVTFFKCYGQINCVYNVILVIHNVLRYSENIQDYKDDLLKKALMRCFNYNTNDKLGILAILTLSYIISDNEVSLLEGATNVIGFLINKIRVLEPSKPSFGGFSIKELVNGLRSLSVNDSIKEKIWAEGGGKLLLNIIGTGFELEVKEMAFEVIHNLCFIKTILEYLKNEYNIKDFIEGFIGHESAVIREHCEGIKYLLSNETMSRCCKESSTGDARYKYDVFISYSRKYKDIIGEIIRNITKNNLTVWVDDEQMYGSTIEAMATGIERSCIVIIAMCRAYKESPNCRHEAEYAFSLHKHIVPVVLQYKYKPNNWLGFIVGTKMYYEFSERRNVSETMSALIHSIERLLRDGNEEEDEENNERIKILLSKKMKEEMTGRMNEEASSRIKVMTKEDVVQWLLQVQLGKYRKSLGEMDGALLATLMILRRESPEYFNKALKEEIKMCFMDVLRFHKAIDDLVNSVGK